MKTIRSNQRIALKRLSVRKVRYNSVTMRFVLFKDMIQVDRFARQSVQQNIL